jgi:prepilin-type processing-associated H-X9-DG protein
MHSWRLLILPFLEYEEIYERYRFDEPWDGPNNRKLHDLVVSAYRCPSHPDQGHSAAYLAVVGPETIWRGSEAVRLEDVTDGTNRVIRLIEVAKPGMHWMDPHDLEFHRMSFVIGEPDGPSSGHPGGANVLMADGSVWFLKKGTGPDRLRASLTIAGGEAIGEEP